MVTYAVIGASRGVGLEYVLQLATRPGAVVFAVVRNAEKSKHLTSAVTELKNVHVIEGDVVNHTSLERAAKEIGAVTGGSLDILIHNAAKMEAGSVFKGFDHYANIDELDAECIDAFKINTLGVIHSIQAFLPLLRAGPTKQIVVIASEAGDPRHIRAAGLVDAAAYGMSKAASLTAVTKYALKLAPEGFTVVNLSPGLVDTSATATAPGEAPDPAVQETLARVMAEFERKGLKALMQTPAQSVRLQLEAIDGLTKEQNGLVLSPTAKVSVPALAVKGDM